ncbi:nuclear transport factor 2 family protein [Natronosporangium hydrolyticum]|uniref:Nuclear transport factor 2 family protein n=1 Tax=Natronosporangium hydrolyticum TaxID=2811111 RepID=A0A895YNF7_9ACTN|nr:nuclear transport factor 2 family protein [Natronosporangium hydrolyticum]QSB16999.1 nuclear transport factor 2 family protein [Natronosporangium hydrolyticum]
MVMQTIKGDETLIGQLVERWVTAVGAGDLAGVVVDHADDIVMFDVPPPQDGVRGIEAYRATWPPFFRWLASGAVFELVQLEVTAGTEVAFAHALLRCGTPEHLAAHPDHRLRVTLGFRKEEGRWLVAHEHHSFPLADLADTAAAAEREIRLLHERWFDATAAKDLDALMAPVAEEVVSYEHEAPLAYAGVDQVRQVCQRGLDAGPGSVTWEVPELTVVAQAGLAVAWGLNRLRVEEPDGSWREAWSRGTRVFRHTDHGWLLVHQHLSFPADPQTGAARTDLRP